MAPKDLSGPAILGLATSLWGMSTAALALTHGTGPMAASATLALIAGLALLALSGVRGINPFKPLRSSFKLFVTIGVLEALNLGLYVAALQLGPTPLVAALHLSTPVLLIIYALAKRHQPVSFGIFAELGLITGAIIYAIWHPGPSAEGQNVPVAATLAILSALFLAVLISVVATASKHQDPDVASGWQLTLAGIVLAPVALLGPGINGEAFGIVTLIGLLLFAPGFALYWRGMRGVGAATGGVIGLNEVIVSSIVVLVLAPEKLTTTSVVAALAVSVVIALEVRRLSSRL